MEQYKQSFLISAIVITVLSIMPFLNGLFELDLVVVSIFGGIPCLWWFASDCLQKSRKSSFAFSFTLVTLACCMLLTRLIMRRMFVIQNGSMEEADGYGSPMAFLLGLAFEMFFFLLFSVIAWQGLFVLLKKRQEQPFDDEQDQ